MCSNELDLQFTVTVIKRCVLSHVGGIDGAYSVSMYYFYGGLWCIVSPCFCRDGVLCVEASLKVACADCRLNWPLLIVHGLICGDSLGFFFVADFFGFFESGAPFRLVPPVRIRCFFDVVSIGLDSLDLFLLLGCMLSESVVGGTPASSSFVGGGRSLSVRAVGYVTKGKGWVVLGVLCLRGRNCCVVDDFSFVGFGLPSCDSASVSSSQHACPHTIASCVLMGKVGVGCKQLACHTMLHRVHSVSVPPVSHTSHWSFLSPSQYTLVVAVRQSRAMKCVCVVASALTFVSGSCRSVAVGVSSLEWRRCWLSLCVTCVECVCVCCVCVDVVPAFFVLRVACLIGPLYCVLIVLGCVCIVGACVGLGRISMFGESEVSCVCGVYPAWTMRLSM